MAEEKKTRYTPEQQAAIDCPGNIIVSASAGSGKTTVMIERLLKAILSGASLDEILCVTFTKKAAANMKEKLRKKLISALGEATAEKTKRDLKEQLAAIPTADISTIHSFCSQLIRRYFYIIGCDGSFDIISSDDSQFKEYIDRAFENLFDRLYEAQDPDFMLLLQFLRRKRRDDNVKAVILDTYFAARAVSHYREKIEASLAVYTPEGFNRICEGLQAAHREQYQALEDVLYSFHLSFIPYFYCMPGEKVDAYNDIFNDMYLTFETAKASGIFDPIPASVSSIRKPVDSKNAPIEVKIAGEYFKSSKEDINRKYKAVRGNIADRDTEYSRFMQSGELARAFARILLQFDDEFTAVKKDENKLDYNDLEHYSLELLSNEEVLKEIRAKYRYVFVDEYQDVNPVQEEIISAIGGQIFLVGDVKQAIYGFRGSKSKFFSDKFDTFESRGGHALRIPTNFRSADAVIRAVNDMFSASMTPSICGFSYKSRSKDAPDAEDAPMSADIAAGAESLLSAPAPSAAGANAAFSPESEPVIRIVGPKGKKTKSETTDGGTASAAALSRDMAARAALSFISSVSATEQGHEMKACEGWPENSGKVTMHIFGEEQKEEIEHKVYSVKEDAKEHKETLEAKAIIQVIRSAYGRPRYDKDLKKEVPTRYGDICILARKNKSLESIVAALTAAQIPVSGAQKGNICDTPEVRQMLDILSVVDNSEQDIALATALLSPLGNFTENELALIRTSVRGPVSSFRDCCKALRDHGRTPLAEKLRTFYTKLSGLRQAAGVLSAGTLMTRILSETGLEAEYSANGGEQLRNVLRLMQEGPELTLSAFLRKIRDGGYSIASPACAPSDCVQVMTMHASKGLEFPVVIIADIWKQFTGRDVRDIYFDETYGFAPRCYNIADRTYSDTILRKYLRTSISREDIKNELNLFYVACTRAETELDIMASSQPPAYSTASALNARNYANLIDFDYSSIAIDNMTRTEAPEDLLSAAVPGPEAPVSVATAPETAAPEAPLPEPSGEPAAPSGSLGEPAGPVMVPVPPEKHREPMHFNDYFEQAYPNECGINLPVKSSATAILHMAQDSETPDDNLFAAEEEQDERETISYDPTGTARGTAYHRFLELCTFSTTREDLIQEEIDLFVHQELMTPEEAAYLNPAELSEILSKPVFQGLEGAQTMREQEFLCRLPANRIMKTKSQDSVLIQGAIDLLICRDGSYSIVDYKYSNKDRERLRETYSAQLNLYRAAVSRITGVPEAEIPATIVNIHRLYTVDVPLPADA